jgi:acyl-CoA thioester hydrolase
MAGNNRPMEAAPADAPEFLWSVRVYYEDTDAAGVVYHSNYLKYMERARTEWLRAAGYSQKDLARDAGIVFVVASMNMEFLSSARLDELLDVRTRLSAVNGPRLVFEQSIINGDGELKCRAGVNIVCVDAGTFRPRRIPDNIKAELFDGD